MNVNKIIPTVDKLKHNYLWSLLFFGLSYLLIPFINNTVAILISLSVVVITAALKEYNDCRSEEGTPEWLDFWFSILTPCLATGLYFLNMFT